MAQDCGADGYKVKSTGTRHGTTHLPFISLQLFCRWHDKLGTGFDKLVRRRCVEGEHELVIRGRTDSRRICSRCRLVETIPQLPTSRSI